MTDWNRKISSVLMGSMCVYALRIREAIDPPLLREEISYMPDMDADVKTKLADGCNYMIYTCRICCNGRDHRRSLVKIVYREICCHV